MLVRLLYASRANAISPELVDAILAASRTRNPERGITGVLCYSGDIFMQVLEGGRDAVCDLFTTIARDARHHTVRLLSYEEITERRFAGWTMGQVNIARLNRSLLLKYSETAVLDPFACTGRAAMALLDELIATAAVVA